MKNAIVRSRIEFLQEFLTTGTLDQSNKQNLSSTDEIKLKISSLMNTDIKRSLNEEMESLRCRFLCHKQRTTLKKLKFHVDKQEKVIGHLTGQTARLVVLLGMILHDKVRVSKMYDTISAAIENARTELDRCKERIQHSSTLGDSKPETSDGVILDQNGVLMTLHSALVDKNSDSIFAKVEDLMKAAAEIKQDASSDMQVPTEHSSYLSLKQCLDETIATLNITREEEGEQEIKVSFIPKNQEDANNDLDTAVNDAQEELKLLIDKQASHLRQNPDHLERSMAWVESVLSDEFDIRYSL